MTLGGRDFAATCISNDDNNSDDEDNNNNKKKTNPVVAVLRSSKQFCNVCSSAACL